MFTRIQLTITRQRCSSCFALLLQLLTSDLRLRTSSCTLVHLDEHWTTVLVRSLLRGHMLQSVTTAVYSHFTHTQPTHKQDQTNITLTPLTRAQEAGSSIGGGLYLVSYWIQPWAKPVKPLGNWQVSRSLNTGNCVW